MFIFYNFIFLLLAVVYLPVYLFRRKFHRGFLARLGRVPEGLDLGRPIWVHAVSVGEVMAVRGLVEQLRRSFPETRFVISTVTPTGNKVAEGIVREGDYLTYLPLDLSFIIRRVIDKVNPRLFIIAETEIWPNLIRYLHTKDIPVITVNGRVSDASFRGYLSIRPLVRPILRKIGLFCVQTELDAQRLMRLGVESRIIKITGNMKFDATDYLSQEADYNVYRLRLGLEAEERLLVAGSTHPGEEEQILEAYKALLNEFPRLRLLIAPRHPQRSREIVRFLGQAGFSGLLVSELPSSGLKVGSQVVVFILDTIGELLSFYAVSDIVFIGGSLVKKGGHNILEPASLGKPVLFGPYMFNFRDIADLFLARQAAIMVQDKEELTSSAASLLRFPARAVQLGHCARELILENRGSTRKNSEYIVSYAKATVS